MLPRFTDRRVGLTMKLDMNWTKYYNDKPEVTFRKEVLLVFHRPSNYTKVLFKDVTDERKPIEMDVHKMKQLSDHDSCWRSDGMRWVFESFLEAWQFFEKHGIEGRDIQPSFHWSIFDGKPSYHFVTLEIENAQDRWNSDYEVVIGNKIPLGDISKYLPKERK